MTAEVRYVAFSMREVLDAARLVQSGLTVHEAAQSLGRCTSQVRIHLKRRGYVQPRPRLHVYERRLCQLVGRSLPRRMISEQVGVPYRTVCHWLRGLGLGCSDARAHCQTEEV